MTDRTEGDERAIDEAIVWHRTSQRDDCNWDGYIEWLEADPRHRLALDEIVLTERIIRDHAPAMPRPHAKHGPVYEVADHPTNESPRTVRSKLARGVWLGGALAAGLAILLLRPATDRVYTTGLDRHAQILLAGRVAIDLAPGSELVAIGRRADRLRLNRGEAVFDIPHDPSRTLSITAGEFAVTDIGTRFAVNLGREFVTVAVSEGQLSVAKTGGTALRLARGRSLFASRDGSFRSISTVPPNDVGSWRSGRLAYQDTPLVVVAADLERYTNRKAVVATDIRGRLFSGTLSIADGTDNFGNLADLMGLHCVVSDREVRLSARDR